MFTSHLQMVSAAKMNCPIKIIFQALLVSTFLSTYCVHSFSVVAFYFSDSFAVIVVFTPALWTQALVLVM